ncbi:hypothetical protein AJ87_31015 [Rhizobium yanglingense]|nr:hypothetical protein AJ87_31015 [Rhizobium yanglingense]
MLKLISNAGLALALTLGGAVAPASFAQAQDVQFRIGPDGVRIYERDRDRYDRYRDDDRRGCSPREAQIAARDSGLRRPEVVRVTRRSVTVQGWTRYGPDRIVFANRRGCPEIG